MIYLNELEVMTMTVKGLDEMIKGLEYVDKNNKKHLKDINNYIECSNFKGLLAFNSYSGLSIKNVLKAVKTASEKTNKTNIQAIAECISYLQMDIKEYIEVLKLKEKTNKSNKDILNNGYKKLNNLDKKPKKLTKKEKNIKKLSSMIAQYLQAGGRDLFKGLDITALSNKAINQCIIDLYQLNLNTINIKFQF